MLRLCQPCVSKPETPPRNRTRRRFLYVDRLSVDDDSCRKVAPFLLLTELLLVVLETGQVAQELNQQQLKRLILLYGRRYLRT